MVRHRFYTLCATPPEALDDGSIFACDLHALPLPNASLDAMVVHHGLEAAEDSRTAVREIARVMSPGGRLVICGFNPYSLWGLRNLLARFSGGSLGNLRPVSPARIVDWLTVLGFELSDEVVHLAHGLPFLRAAPPRRPHTADPAPARWRQRVRNALRRHRPPFGGVYIIVAFKQVGAVRPDLTVPDSRAGKLAPVAYPKLSAWNRIER